MEQTIAHGCGCGHQGQSPTEILSDEHRVIERVLDVFEALAARPLKGSFDHWKHALDFARHFADQCHHYKEEKILFPALEEHGIPREEGPVGMMMLEHEEGRSYVRGMFAALAQIEATDESAQAALRENARQYVRLLREHIQKEDDILFRMADEVIPVDEQIQMLKDFDAHEAEEIGSGVHEKYLQIARELAALV